MFVSFNTPPCSELGERKSIHHENYWAVANLVAGKAFERR